MMKPRVTEFPGTAKRATAAFTMIEVAISLAILGFALVAIMGVLPSGLQVQKDNREDTLVNQDGAFLLEAITSGAQGTDDLTNYVEWVKVTTLNNNRQVIVSNRFLDARYIVGLLTTPKYIPINNQIVSNRVQAKMRSVTGAAVEKNTRMRDVAFTYLVNAEVVPFEAYPPMFTNFTQRGLSAPDVMTRSNRWVQANRMGFQASEVRLVFRWPVLANDSVGSGRQVFRTVVAHPLVFVPTNNNNNLYFFTNRFAQVPAFFP